MFGNGNLKKESLDVSLSQYMQLKLLLNRKINMMGRNILD